jgi:hypothetical protein
MSEITNIIEVKESSFKITLQDSVGGRYTTVECQFSVKAIDLIEAITNRWNLPKGIKGILIFKDGQGKGLTLKDKDEIYGVVKGKKKGTLIIDFERTAG